MKTCSKCKIEKPRSEFGKHASKKDGLRGVCKLCNNASAKKYRDENPEIHLAAVSRWATNNPERVSENHAKWRAANYEYKTAATAAWRDANREWTRQYSAEYRANNPEKVALATKKYRTENPDKTAKQNAEWRLRNYKRKKETTEAWCKANPDKVKIKLQNRRARKKAAGGKLSPGIIADLFARQNGCCVFCQADLTTVVQHLDHVMPLALGGPNTDDNVQLLCARCNTRKGAKHPAEFARIIFEERLATSIASTCSSSADTSQRSRQSD